MVVGKRKNENIIGISNIFLKKPSDQTMQNTCNYVYSNTVGIETITLFNENAVT